MAYIGFNPSQLAIAPFATKYFTGDGVTTTFTLDQSVPGANESNVEVFVENVQQNPVDAYTIGGALNNQLIFSEAPVVGGAIYVVHKGEATYNLQPATGSVTANTLDPVLRNFTVDKFTGTGAQTAFTLSDTPYSPNSILVSVDGIVQQAGTNYTLAGTTLTFAAEAPDLGSDITVIHLGFSSGNKAVMDASITPVKLSTGGPSWDTSSNLTVTGRLGIGGTYSTWKLGVNGAAYIGPVSANNATSKVEMQTNAVLQLKPHTNNSTNMNFASIAGGDAMGIQVTNSAGAANWHVVLSPFGGNVGVGTGSTVPSQLLTIGDSTASIRGQIQVWGSIGSSPTIALDHTPTSGRRYTLYSGGSGTNNFDIYDNSPGFGVRRFTIDGNGVVDLPYGQIKFPAVQNASSDPNTLDDYEEGSFTPTLLSSSVSPVGTYFAATGNCFYVKIASLVNVYGYVNITNTIATGNQWLVITGLPFNMNLSADAGISGTTNNYPRGSGFYSGIVIDNTSANATEIWLGWNNGTAQGNGDKVYFNLTYRTTT